MRRLAQNSGLRSLALGFQPAVVCDGWKFGRSHESAGVRRGRWASSGDDRERGQTFGLSTNWKFVATVRGIGFQPVCEKHRSVWGRWAASCRWEAGMTLDGADKLEVRRHGSSRAHPGRHRALNSTENPLRGRRFGGRCEAAGGLRRGGPADRRGNAGPTPSSPFRSAPKPALPTPLPPPDSATHDTWRRLV